MNSLLSEVVERCLDFSTPRLLHSQRWQGPGYGGEETRRRGWIDHLPEEYKADVKPKLQNAYAMVDFDAPKRALESLRRELLHINPSAARSLAEGMEETLTVHKIGDSPPTAKDLAART